MLITMEVSFLLCSFNFIIFFNFSSIYMFFDVLFFLGTNKSVASKANETSFHHTPSHDKELGVCVCFL